MKLKMFTKQMKKTYESFIKYFEDKWLSMDFISVDQEDREILERTNNGCEGFHSYLSKFVWK